MDGPTIQNQQFPEPRPHSRKTALPGSHQHEVDFARTDRDAVALAEIDAELQRLASGHYGLCTDCGEAIALARLQSAPQVQRCVACETRLECGQPRPATL